MQAHTHTHTSVTPLLAKLTPIITLQPRAVDHPLSLCTQMFWEIRGPLHIDAFAPDSDNPDKLLYHQDSNCKKYSSHPRNTSLCEHCIDWVFINVAVVTLA